MAPPKGKKLWRKLDVSEVGGGCLSLSLALPSYVSPLKRLRIILKHLLIKREEVLQWRRWTMLPFSLSTR
jgi:hypothetical protein